MVMKLQLIRISLAEFQRFSTESKGIKTNISNTLLKFLSDYSTIQWNQ